MRPAYGGVGREPGNFTLPSVYDQVVLIRRCVTTVAPMLNGASLVVRAIFIKVALRERKRCLRIGQRWQGCLCLPIRNPGGEMADDLGIKGVFLRGSRSSAIVADEPLPGCHGAFAAWRTSRPVRSLETRRTAPPTWPPIAAGKVFVDWVGSQ